ncbi:MAG: patatin-like phospholipase family protein, partial [Burkholderiales bacterium]|nr:patatin-like phospholipase family protein [Burkholderiales bacterium]
MLASPPESAPLTSATELPAPAPTYDPLDPTAADRHCLPDRSDAVRDLAHKLSALGYYHGPLTAKIDELHKAIQAFQEAENKKIAIENAKIAFKNAKVISSRQETKAKQAIPLLPTTGICNAATWLRLIARTGNSFAEVWQNELDAVQDAEKIDPSQQFIAQAWRRYLLSQPEAQTSGTTRADDQVLLPAIRPANLRDVYARAHKAKLAGLALSGGGIRSATFNLGVLQALAENKLLHQFDYLSTVSGGGYIGGWLSKWIKEENGDVKEVEKLLTPGSAKNASQFEAHEIKFLRQYSNYLTPQTGLFSADSWAMISTWLRNTILNLFILISLIAALMVIPYAFVLSLAELANYPRAVGYASLAFFVFAVFQMGFHLSLKPIHHNRRKTSQGKVLRYVIAPLLAAATLACIFLWAERDAASKIWHKLTPAHMENFASLVDFSHAFSYLLLLGFVYFLAWSAGWLTAQSCNAKYDKQEGVNLLTSALNNNLQAHEASAHLLSSLAAYVVGGFLTLAGLQFFAGMVNVQHTKHWGHMLGIGIPLLLIVYGCTMVLQVGLIGRFYSEQSREWWSRLGGWIAIAIIAWLGLFAVTFYAPPLLSWVHFAAENHWISLSIGGGWVSITLSGLLMGHSDKTEAIQGEAKHDKAKEGKSLKLPTKIAISIAPYAFAIGILGLISTMVHFLVVPEHLQQPLFTDGGKFHPGILQYIDYYLILSSQPTWTHVIATFFGFALLCLLFAWRLDINKFSLHMMSRNRVVRAYLGASSKNRQPHPFTGFDPADDPHLASLKTGTPPQTTPQRPYHLLNACLNLVGGKELAWQNRKAANFLFSPQFCGYQFPINYHNAPQFGRQLGEQGCFRPTQLYANTDINADENEKGTRLGMAIAISGAAVSPAMGYHSSPSMSFLLTLFNLRLGQWCPNPRQAKWQSSGPSVGLFCMMRELFGLADANSNYVYLSDGGHFENLGVYELVRRRCRLIVVVDASADGEMEFEDLGNMIRKCYTDMG